METDILKAKVDDAVRLSRRGPRFIGFLTPAETSLLQDYIKYNTDAEFVFWGGHDDAERQILAVCQPYDLPLSFPITPITLRFREQDELSHRDFLGSLMAQGVVRPSLGDILAEKGRAVIFVKSELSDYFLSNITKVGRTGVKTLLGAEEPYPCAHSFQDMSGVVASGRLDCITAFLLNTSREKAVSAISAGLVSVNYREAVSVSRQIQEGDKISVQHTGKFIVDQLGPLTKKGRLSLKCRKYI